MTLLSSTIVLPTIDDIITVGGRIVAKGVIDGTRHTVNDGWGDGIQLGVMENNNADGVEVNSFSKLMISQSSVMHEKQMRNPVGVTISTDRDIVIPASSELRKLVYSLDVDGVMSEELNTRIQFLCIKERVQQNNNTIENVHTYDTIEKNNIHTVNNPNINRSIQGSILLSPGGPITISLSIASFLQISNILLYPYPGDQLVLLNSCTSTDLVASEVIINISNMCLRIL